MSDCKQGERNAGDIQDLFRLLEERNSTVVEMGKSFIRLEGKVDNLVDKLEIYMQEGHEYRSDVKKNNLLRLCLVGIVIFAGGVGTITGAIYGVARLVNM